MAEKAPRFDEIDGEEVAPRFDEIQEAPAPAAPQARGSGNALLDWAESLAFPTPTVLGASGAAANAKKDRSPVGGLLSAVDGVATNAAPYIAAGFDALGKAPADTLDAVLNDTDRVARKGMAQTFMKSAGPEFDASLRKWHPVYQQAKAEEPALNLLGNVAAPIPNVFKGAGVVPAGGRILQNTALGSLAAYLGANPDDIQAQREAADDGATMSTAVSAGLEAAGPVVGALGPPLLRFGRERVLKTLSPSKADYGKWLQMGITEDMADDLMKSGAVGPLSNTSDVGERLAPTLEARGAKLGNYIDNLDAATGGKTVTPKAMAGDIRSRAASEFSTGTSPHEGAKSAALGEADLIEKRHGQPPLYIGVGPRPEASISLRKAEGIKRSLDEAVIKELLAEAKGAQPAASTSGKATARDAIKSHNEMAAERAAESLAPELAGQFKPLKKQYGLAAEAMRTIEKTAGPKAANRFMQPSDYGFGVASGQAFGGDALGDLVSKPVGETLMGTLGAIAHNQVRTRGSALMSHAGYGGSSLAAGGATAARSVAGSPAATATATNLLKKYLGITPESDEDLAQLSFVKSTGG